MRSKSGKKVVDRIAELKKKVNARSKAWYDANTGRVKENGKAYRAANPERARNNQLRRIGTTLEQFNYTLRLQLWACAVCKADFRDLPKRQAQQDHCHATGKVRGILCHKCNIGLGNFKDDPIRLRAAADYIERRAHD